MQQDCALCSIQSQPMLLVDVVGCWMSLDRRAQDHALQQCLSMPAIPTSITPVVHIRMQAVQHASTHPAGFRGWVSGGFCVWVDSGWRKSRGTMAAPGAIFSNQGSVGVPYENHATQTETSSGGFSMVAFSTSKWNTFIGIRERCGRWM